ncbi:hypothetical protein SAMN06265365_11597 [Tistlia consotensis]|uniref:Uncharacterized protein n=1 Tax=Tistlia consotensis USBA 355 TaxID=560819 RepID=A0A1Y6C4U1_9PROT|nr:hypothetical protein [Tistlia consotensis]SMF45743.1 hypothetical protein SAMN05428998_11636 [Tistlia consotensis USBA 355]SNR79384.1 hypothetical protein SAMN06265365_11597 [Tistlia consotensis]
MVGTTQFFTDVQSADVLVQGVKAGIAVSLGTAQIFYTARQELAGLDGTRFASFDELVRKVADRWRLRS